jgi:hypothetical protein
MPYNWSNPTEGQAGMRPNVAVNVPNYGSLIAAIVEERDRAQAQKDAERDRIIGAIGQGVSGSLNAYSDNRDASAYAEYMSHLQSGNQEGAQASLNSMSPQARAKAMQFGMQYQAKYAPTEFTRGPGGTYLYGQPGESQHQLHMPDPTAPKSQKEFNEDAGMYLTPLESEKFYRKRADDEAKAEKASVYTKMRDKGVTPESLDVSVPQTDPDNPDATPGVYRARIATATDAKDKKAGLKPGEVVADSAGNVIIVGGKLGKYSKVEGGVRMNPDEYESMKARKAIEEPVPQTAREKLYSYQQQVKQAPINKGAYSDSQIQVLRQQAMEAITQHGENPDAVNAMFLRMTGQPLQ